MLSEGTDVLFVGCGEMTVRAKAAAEILGQMGISAGVIDVYRVKPLNEEILVKSAQKVKLVITVEEHSPYGGLGSMVAQTVGRNCPKKVINLSLPDGHIVSGTAEEAFAYYGLTAEGIAKTAKEELQ